MPEEQGTRFFFAEMIKIPVKVTIGSTSVFDRLAIISEKQRHAVLATDAKGQPYASLITFTLTPDRRNLIFATPRDFQNIGTSGKTAGFPCSSIPVPMPTDHIWMQRCLRYRESPELCAKERRGMPFADCSSENIQNLKALYGRKVRQ